MHTCKTPRRLLALALILLSLRAAAQFSTEKADQLIDAYGKAGKFNGSVLIGQKGQVLYRQGYGFRDVAAKKPNDAHSICQIGSITKQFTSAVILQLQRSEKLSVQDKLSKYFPQLPHGDSITLENLLTHTSGLYNYTR